MKIKNMSANSFYKYLSCFCKLIFQWKKIVLIFAHFFFPLTNLPLPGHMVSNITFDIIWKLLISKVTSKG